MPEAVKKFQNKKLALMLISYFIPCVLYSQATGTKWIVYNMSNSGLPNNHVKAIAIDDEGNKWIGTNWGLTRFDDRNWINYNKKDKNSMQFIAIKSIVVDQLGDIWTATRGDGLAKLMVSEPSLTQNTGSPINTYINADLKYNPDKITSYAKWLFFKEHNSPLPINSAKSVFIEPNGNKWIGTDGGVVEMSSESWGSDAQGGLKWKVYDTFNSGLPNNVTYVITSDRSGNKWIGTYGGGLAKFDGTFWTVYNIRNSGLPDNYVISITTDQKDNIWIGTYSGGLAKFDGYTGWEIYKTSNSQIPDNYIYAVAVDSSGNIWTGSHDSGLAKFDGTKWTSYNILDSTKPYTVNSIAIDKKGNKWIGTVGGLVVFNENGINE